MSEAQQKLADQARERMLGKKLSPETIAKRTAARLEKYGKYTQNWSNGGAKRASENGMAKRVRCIETGAEYPSAVDAAEATGFPYNHICENARGVRKSACGTHWEYLDPPKPRKPRSEESKLKNSGADCKCAKPVMCIETGEVFGAQRILAEYLGVRPPIVAKFLKKDGEFNGLHYKRIDKGDYLNGIGIQKSQT